MARSKKISPWDLMKFIRSDSTSKPRLLIEMDGKKYYLEFEALDVNIKRNLETKFSAFPKPVKLTRDRGMDITITGYIDEGKTKFKVEDFPVGLVSGIG